MNLWQSYNKNTFGQVPSGLTVQIINKIFFNLKGDSLCPQYP